jgi:hypothetical protein
MYRCTDHCLVPGFIVSVEKLAEGTASFVSLLDLLNKG